MSLGANTDPSARLGSLISVVSFERQKLVAELLTEADLNTLKHLARKGMPENSLRTLTSDLAYLEVWCLAATGDGRAPSGAHRNERSPGTEKGPTPYLCPVKESAGTDSAGY